MDEVKRYYQAMLLEKESTKPELARLIIRARKLKGLSIKDMAAELKVNRSAIQHWEHGRRVPSAHNALQLSILLEIPLEKLCARSAREMLRSPSNCPQIPRFFMI